jgi:hypothetical protein
MNRIMWQKTENFQMRKYLSGIKYSSIDVIHLLFPPFLYIHSNNLGRNEKKYFAKFSSKII